MTAQERHIALETDDELRWECEHLTGTAREQANRALHERESAHQAYDALDGHHHWAEILDRAR